VLVTGSVRTPLFAAAEGLRATTCPRTHGPAGLLAYNYDRGCQSFVHARGAVSPRDPVIRRARSGKVSLTFLDIHLIKKSPLALGARVSSNMHTHTPPSSEAM
jgi:hypothetical protein